jgi:serine protease inhibitor
MAAPRGPAVLTHAELGVRLFRALAEGAGGRNLFVSPVSAGMALTLAYNGATGDARDEMARALGFSGMTLDEVNAGQERLDASLEETEVELALASALWMNAKEPLDAGFVERARRSFGAEAASVDFGDPETARRLDAWAAEATRGRIPRFASPITADLVVLLASVVYFKARWQTQFDPARTQDMPFRTGRGETIAHPLMRLRGWFGLRQGEGFRALRMPYGDDRFAAYVLLPDEGSSVEALVAGLTADGLEAVFRTMPKQDAIVAFPRVTLRGALDLIPPLRALGMEAAFRPGAFALEEIVTPEQRPADVFITTAMQQTFVEMSEEGTEAAAMSEVSMSRSGSSDEPKPVRFTVDRPFVVAILDDRTGALLFLGQVTDPAAAE